MYPAELRQTLQAISQRLESVNAATQEHVYAFTELYVDPCLSSLKECLVDFTSPCCPGRDEQSRRKRGRSRGRAELNFDFYEDWDNDETYDNNLMGWGNDELDSLLVRSSRQDVHPGQPRWQPALTYGATGRSRRNPAHQDGQPDPTIIPSSSYLGFLERLPFKIGGKLRYKPSAADLQEHVGGPKGLSHGAHDDELNRQRRAASDSRSTTNSLSSRGDLIPSDEEADAVPLDDEFAMALERRATGATLQDRSSGKSRSGQMSRDSRTPTGTLSSLSTRKSNGFGRVGSIKSQEDVERPSAILNQSLTELEKKGEDAEQDASAFAQDKEAVQTPLADQDIDSSDAALQAEPTIASETSAKAAEEDVAGDMSSTKPDQT